MNSPVVALSITALVFSAALSPARAQATGGSLWSVGHAVDGRIGDGRSFAVATPVVASVTRTAAGRFHSLIVKTDGTLWGTGLNSSGQLGDGTTINRTLPVQIATDVAAAAAGDSHSLFLKKDGTLWAMGSNVHGQLGDGTTSRRLTPVQVASNVAAFAAGANHSLFTQFDDTLWAMGFNQDGQLGIGARAPQSTPVRVASSVRAVAAGAGHSLFIKLDGSLWSMGADSTPVFTPSIPHEVATGVAAIAAGGNHSLLLKTDATLWSFGRNETGQLGDGSTFTRLAPVQVASGVSAMAAGSTHSAFIKTDGTLWTMGANSHGELGNDNNDLSNGEPLAYRTRPALVAIQVAAIAAGGGFTAYVSTNGSLLVVGENPYGALGNGTTDDRIAPVLLSTGAIKVATSATGGHALFLDRDGGLWGIGDNSAGQLGDGTTTRRTAPVRVATEVADVAVGKFHTLFARRDGTLWAAGLNNWGQLGDGTQQTRRTPVQIATNVIALAAGDYHSAYVQAGGSLWRMGQNNSGPLPAIESTPFRVAPTGVTAIAAGSTHTLYLTSDGSLWGYGRNLFGQIGDFDPPAGVTAVVIADGVRTIAAGGDRTFFVKNDGTLWACGDNTWGALGSEGFLRQRQPIPVATNVRSVSTGAIHSAFVKTDNTLWTMGLAGDGGLGAGVLLFLGQSTQVATNVLHVFAGAAASYFIPSVPAGGAPIITTQPAAPPFVPGTRLTLRVTATGAAPMGFRWRKDGIELAGEREDTLTIPLVERTHWGEYDVVATNTAGSVTSVKVRVGLPLATITAQPPEAIAAQAGERVVLAVSASSDLPVTYQWKRDGINIPGATAATLTLDAAAAGDAGTYTVAITNANGTILSRAVTLTVALPTSRIANLSVRTEAGTGAQMLIVGIALGGPNTSGNGAILIRGIGPSLSTFDITGYLPDPNIGFYEGSTVVATNDNWGGTTALGTLFTQVGAFPLTGPTSLDAALALTPRGGTYTVQVAGAAGTTGNALVEIYDASTGASAPRLVNVSARAQVGGAGGSLIAGFVITGSGAKTVLIRAIGPTLGAFGVPGTLADPRVELLKSGVTAPFASNDNWSGTAAMAETFRQVGAFQLAAGTRDAAILVTLEAGAYTAQVTSGDASAGVALVEVYEVP